MSKADTQLNLFSDRENPVHEPTTPESVLADSTEDEPPFSILLGDKQFFPHVKNDNEIQAGLTTEQLAKKILELKAKLNEIQPQIDSAIDAIKNQQAHDEEALALKEIRLQTENELKECRKKLEILHTQAKLYQ